MPTRRYIIYADESEKNGRYYSNFFGGVLLDSARRQAIEQVLDAAKADLGLLGELKWQKVDRANVERYEDFIRIYFRLIAGGDLKVRIMFTQNINVPTGIEDRHDRDRYFLLYYQFIKHAFGITHCNPDLANDVSFTILPDKIPDKKEKFETFKDYLCRIPDTRLVKHKRISIPREDIADVDSKKHVILQGLDVILGSMSAKLNERLYDKPPGKRNRGKRTLAKERLYKTINREIRVLYPGFNIGANTGRANGSSDQWHHPYRHWLFKPKSFTVNRSLGKKATPTLPT